MVTSMTEIRQYGELITPLRCNSFLKFESKFPDGNSINHFI